MTIYLIPFISAFIGWFTNWIAIKMLFHPKEEKNILGIKIQGIFPKRQQQFAEKPQRGRGPPRDKLLAQMGVFARQKTRTQGNLF